MKLGTTKNHVMLDLETMGSGSQSAIIAIGAVKFNDDGVNDSFYEKVSLKSSVDAGLEMDPDTVIWWLKQSKEAQEEFTKENITLGEALLKFKLWIETDALIWGNGASFDNVILGNAYKAIGESQPWMFWNDMCYRTIKNLNRHIKLEREGTHHNALDDAKSQARHLIQILNQ